MVTGKDKEIIKESVKELMELTKWCQTFKETGDITEMEQRLTDVTYKLIDVL